MKVRRKSLWRSVNAKRKKLRASQRAAKERKRRARGDRGEAMPDGSACVPIGAAVASGFRVTIECLDDGERVSLTATRTPWGLSVSPTLAGRKVAAVLAGYRAEGARSE